ncbi:UDP-N-acetylglucosamine 2-epimerase [Flavobacterium sp. Root186]|uniref:UDP-N-acetylglucosamine 2-epimerase n=1 Tax=Flavobacterium sp. Root186 TaxID=1736485 RepID=UPI0006F58F02|nr:UDP-N-acetylglucosamine 2-epimerase [Flavobacterium sp. Root186]KRB57283.1 UDP-N-acetyl glucosamine 2-epimerase [Flavobacterium sp. Root186]
MKIGILTSSRADYGIYLPFLQKIKDDPFFELEIIAFGTHLSKNHGYTLNEIEVDKYNCVHTISALISNDDEESIVTSYGLTILKFADFWERNKYDLVFCLGDRFEMSAAVQAGIVFGIRFAHFHGGETTLGAIDNIYRHQITLASSLHFTATDVFKEKVINLIGSSKEVYSVGSLSLNDIKDFRPIDKNEFYKKYAIPEEEFILVTFHPETISIKENFHFANEMKKALLSICKETFVIITMPNADTQGSVYRELIQELKKEMPDRFLLIENFGKQNYFSAMYYAKILLGNTSSGILEAASFGKYVVNVGDRQKGRVQSDNILNSDFKEESIISAVNIAMNKGKFEGDNVYFKDKAADNIIKIVKIFHENI